MFRETSIEDVLNPTGEIQTKTIPPQRNSGYYFTYNDAYGCCSQFVVSMLLKLTEGGQS